MGTGKGQKRARQHPVEVAILNTLIILVLLNVKRGKIQEMMLNGLLETVQTVQQGQIVCTMAKWGVTKFLFIILLP